LGLSHQNPAAFSEVLTHTSSLYFTVVTFGTVGFGDIRPVTDLARLVVTSQIVVDVLFIAFVVRGILELSKRAVERS
jgi:voltage-gated potassium channel Kch